MRFLLLVALATLVLPSPALAGWGDENWGTMLWGPPASVPALEWVGLLVLALAWPPGHATSVLEGSPALLVLVLSIAPQLHLFWASRQPL